MRACFSRAAAAAATALVLMLSASAHAQGDGWALAREASEAMELSDYETAASTIASLEALYGDVPAVLWVRGKLRFHQGEYEAALADLDAAVSAGAPAAVRSLRDLVAETIDVVSDYAVYTTRDGLFEIRYDASRDEVLIPWAEATLEAAYYEIGYDLGYWPEPPIRVEIYPRSSTLARTSSLTLEAIETSGTIALCKYNKLMFTSPRATARGYGWRDTLSHEYVHYVISHLTHAEVPIWMHEAYARYLEQRWTGSRAPSLAPSREELLTRRVASGDLITFEQMHPSMAYLPSAEDASVAYSEVFTLLEYLVARRGTAALRQILYAVRDGAGIEQAFEQVLGEPFERFESGWMAALRARPLVEIPGDFHEEIELVPDEVRVDDDEPEIASVEARDLVHLGELLRARGHVAASIVQYERAEAVVGRANPVLQNALAQAYLDQGRAADAMDALSDVRRWHPEYYYSHLYTGRALNALGRPADALEVIEQAVGINPFDPAVHDALADARSALGDDEGAERARADSRRVTR